MVLSNTGALDAINLTAAFQKARWHQALLACPATAHFNGPRVTRRLMLLPMCSHAAAGKVLGRDRAPRSCGQGDCDQQPCLCGACHHDAGAV